MSEDVFEINDKSGRKIRLTKKQWRHLAKKHPYIEKYLDEIKETLQFPDKIAESLNSESKFN